MSSSIRIVDMPDLGVVTDDSSVVGEHAGSGRFNAMALRRYMGSGVVNVLDYGAKGDGASDDTPAIQQTLDKFAGSAIVFIPDTGKPYVCDTLTVPSNTDLLIDGTVKLRAHPTNHLIYVNNANNVTIRGHGTLDGNNAVNVYPAVGVGSLFIALCTNVQVSGVTIQNAPLWNMNAQQSSRVLISGVAMIGGRNANEFASGCDECWLMNCTIDGPDEDIGFAFYGGITNSGAIGNTVKNSGNVGNQSAVGIVVLADPDQSAACSNLVISNNIVHHCGGSGIGVISVTGNYHDGIVISDNRCSFNGRRPIGSRGDIDINGATHVMVSDNHTASFGGTSTDAWFGLTAGMVEPASAVSFIGNHVYNVGQGVGVGFGLYVNSVPNLLASGNFFYDDQSSHTMGTAIGGTAGASNAFIGNYCDQTSITVAPQPDTVIANVVGGLWSFGSGGGPNSLNVRVNGTAGHPSVIEYAVNGTPRWYVGNSGSAEGTAGSNTGSDFVIWSTNDTGGGLSATIAISRATGRVTLEGAPTITSPLFNATNDAAAAAGAVPVGGMYRSGSALMIRVS